MPVRIEERNSSLVGYFLSLNSHKAAARGVISLDDVRNARQTGRIWAESTSRVAITLIFHGNELSDALEDLVFRGARPFSDRRSRGYVRCVSVRSMYSVVPGLTTENTEKDQDEFNLLYDRPADTLPPLR